MRQECGQISLASFLSRPLETASHLGIIRHIGAAAWELGDSSFCRQRDDPLESLTEPILRPDQPCHWIGSASDSNNLRSGDKFRKITFGAIDANLQDVRMTDLA
jgi:hypothetical protein